MEHSDTTLRSEHNRHAQQGALQVVFLKRGLILRTTLENEHLEADLEPPLLLPLQTLTFFLRDFTSIDF